MWFPFLSIISVLRMTIYNVREKGWELELKQGASIRHSSTDTLVTIQTLCCVPGRTKLVNNGHERNSKILHSIAYVAVLEAKIISRSTWTQRYLKIMSQLNRLYGSAVASVGALWASVSLEQNQSLFFLERPWADEQFPRYECTAASLLLILCWLPHTPLCTIQI